jgi:hypothetical protein
MINVYLLPEGFIAPELNWEDSEQYDKECTELTDRLRTFCIKRNNQKNVGEVIRFQVADGYAEYMVAATKPVQLIHLPFWDAYQSETAYLMTAKAIQQNIDQTIALNKLFSK